MSKLYLVFDVESVGLHGEGFAVGGVVVDGERNTHDRFSFACPRNAARGDKEGFEWLEKNCPELAVTHTAPGLVRSAFWKRWLEWKERGAVLVADCAWPVEARFLAQCIDDVPVERQWQGPYPLHDVASLLLAQGLDPLLKRERIGNHELPAHDPLADAEQSARIMLDALKKL